MNELTAEKYKLTVGEMLSVHVAFTDTWKAIIENYNRIGENHQSIGFIEEPEAKSYPSFVFECKIAGLMPEFGTYGKYYRGKLRNEVIMEYEPFLEYITRNLNHT